MKFDLKFEIADGKNPVNLGGGTFLPAKQAIETFWSELWSKFRGHFRELRFKFLVFFFVQQKGGASLYSWEKYRNTPLCTAMLWDAAFLLTVGSFLLTVELFNFHLQLTIL